MNQTKEKNSLSEVSRHMYFDGLEKGDAIQFLLKCFEFYEVRV